MIFTPKPIYSVSHTIECINCGGHIEYQKWDIEYFADVDYHLETYDYLGVTCPGCGTKLRI